MAWIGRLLLTLTGLGAVHKKDEANSARRVETMLIN